MPKPTTRLPSTPAAAATAATTAPAVTPSPDNGVPFADLPRPGRRASSNGTNTSQPIKRRGKQIAVRIPEDLYARLQACMDGTRYPQNRLVERALDAELKQQGY